MCVSEADKLKLGFFGARTFKLDMWFSPFVLADTFAAGWLIVDMLIFPFLHVRYLRLMVDEFNDIPGRVLKCGQDT